MKKVFLSASALILATAFSFAGTPETKAETKAKPEVKTETTLVYHYTGKDASGKIQFAAGEPPVNCNNAGSVPCRWESPSPMTSPQTEAYINSNADVTHTRSNN
ncbi:DUF6520 family protein [Sphingobacterium sp. BIGb0116]|uniref:DUF6520 family protein n=1 Tax=Sphingobacterium sp. BIGb0116 TaxID=2940619 RepID=UPI002169CCB3|nr:DUF6520 family protein [Sphingobacterium sp. BIGb0116]MCS4165174.1 hypothetical protein [Sphingobacterium sp. BIGb0116]